MLVYRYFTAFTIAFILCFTSLPAHSQMGFSLDIKKPRQYEERLLGSEKTGQKKFTAPRRFVQNTVTHYNYFFNASNKLNEIIEDAKEAHQDDYTQLLSFYNYRLDVTATRKRDLDSIIQKSSTGIVLHDLRNDWIDNLYLLIGAAYYLRKDFDSAYLTFQFINYAFAEKEKDGYYKTIGSRIDGNNALSISTKEKNSLPRKVFSEPPSRNDALIWQIRTFIGQDAYAEAASLIVTLKNDPNFPKRLKNDLEEVQALWFYNQNAYDSAAAHLEKALGNAPTKREKARWEYLIAQLYELSNQYDKSREFYEKVINHTTDPVMEVYARLNAIRMNKEEGENYINRNITGLLKMAKKDKYIDYRDILYFTAAQMEMERGNTEAARTLLYKSTEYNSNNITQRNRAFLQLGELAIGSKKYAEASRFYDSVNLNDPALKNIEQVQSKKEMLKLIAGSISIIERQDSLQRIAAMPEDERTDFVKKLVRQLRRQQGLKDENLPGVSVPSSAQDDIFATSTSKGEWYFYNQSLRSKGTSVFKARWGNRPNVDNWRRNTGLVYTALNRPGGFNAGEKPLQANDQPVEISFENVYNNLPITEEKLKESNDSIARAMFQLGKAYAEKAEDCSLSIEILESFRSRFSDAENIDEALFILHYCYKKSGNAGAAEEIRKRLSENYSKSPFTSIINTGKDPNKDESNPEIGKVYEDIYNLFIEGDFTAALELKKKTDSIHGNNYWTPRLLYIESVYYIHQKKDSAAKKSLNEIITRYAGTALADKATTLVDVLNRRRQIEAELKALVISRPAADTIQKKDITPDQKTASLNPVLPAKGQDQPADSKPAANTTKNIADSVSKTISGVSSEAVYKFTADEKYYAVIVLNKVDNIWANEAKNAFSRYNLEKNNALRLEGTIRILNGDYKLLLIGHFNNFQSAIDYLSATKPLASSRIIPWLTANKYSFSVISTSNLAILENKKDWAGYQSFISPHEQGKF